MAEIVIHGQALYCQADLTPCDVQDAKLPESLLEALPMIAPLDKKIFLTQALNETGERIKGHWQFNPKMLAGVPKLDWKKLYNLA